MSELKFDFVACCYNGGEAIQRYEECESFLLSYVKNGQIMRQEFLSASRREPETVIKSLRQSGMTALIARSFSPKAMAALRKAGLRLYEFAGGTGAALKAYLAGQLQEL